MIVRLACLAFAAAVTPTVAFYGANSAVVTLTPDNFDTLVVKDDAVWLVEFYASWCGHCKSLTPEYKKAADATKGFAKMGAVDADQHQSLGSQYGVQGFPTLKIFGENKKKPVDYQGSRDAKGMADALMKEARSIVTSRLNGGGSSKSKTSNKQKKSDSGSGSKGGDKVVELTADNFDDLVVNGDDAWIVAFTAPWCGHCKNLKPAWKEAAAKLSGKVRLGNVDATVHQALGQRFQVQGYPTIKVFAGSSRKNGKPYEGGRTAEDIVQFGLTMAPPPKVLEIADPAQFKVCESEMCIVTFVPSLWEADAKARKQIIKTLKEVAKKNAGQGDLNWFWTAPGAQPELQETLTRGSTGYPSVYAVSGAKKISVGMRSGFDGNNLGKFVVGLGRGKIGQAQQLKQLPKVVKADKWDGKDAKPVEVEEISLEELFGDDDDEPAKEEL